MLVSSIMVIGCRKKKDFKSTVDMRYLVIENGQHEELTYDIIGFFWDNGNEIAIQKKYSDRDDNYVRADCIISLDNSRFSQRDIVNKKLFLHFCNEGVYSNAIPFPYKIFEFEGLNRHTLAAFFFWCKRLNLFEK